MGVEGIEGGEEGEEVEEEVELGGWGKGLGGGVGFRIDIKKQRFRVCN